MSPLFALENLPKFYHGKGFKIVRNNDKKSEYSSFHLNDSMKADGIYIFIYGGHGAIGALVPKEGGNNNVTVSSGLMNLPYKLAVIMLWACYSAQPQTFDNSVFKDEYWKDGVSSNGGQFFAYWGVGRAFSALPEDPQPPPAYDPDYDPTPAWN